MNEDFIKFCENSECRGVFYTKDNLKLYCCIKCKKEAGYLRTGNNEALKKGETSNEKQILIIPNICFNFNCRETINENYIKGKPQKFCSDKCKRYFNYHSKNSKNSKTTLNKEIEGKAETSSNKEYKVLCSNCGEKFIGKRSTATFCCSKCKSSFNNYMRRREWVHKEKTWRYAIDDEANIINNIFIDCIFDNVNFDDMELINTKFIRCLFKGDCTFNGSYLYKTEFKDCYYKINGDLEIRNAKNKFSKFDDDFIKAIGGSEKMSNMIHMKGSLAAFKNELNETLTNKARER